jgi:hypothetical protein
MEPERPNGSFPQGGGSTLWCTPTGGLEDRTNHGRSDPTQVSETVELCQYVDSIKRRPEAALLRDILLQSLTRSGRRWKGRNRSFSKGTCRHRRGRIRMADLPGDRRVAAALQPGNRAGSEMFDSAFYNNFTDLVNKIPRNPAWCRSWSFALPTQHLDICHLIQLADKCRCARIVRTPDLRRHGCRSCRTNSWCDLRVLPSARRRWLG